MDVPPSWPAAIGNEQGLAKRDIGKTRKPVETGGGSERGG